MRKSEKSEKSKKGGGKREKPALEFKLWVECGTSLCTTDLRYVIGSPVLTVGVVVIDREIQIKRY